jgi:hypothetical protein
MKKAFLLLLIPLITFPFLMKGSDAKILELAKVKSHEYSVPNKKYVVIVDYTKPIFLDRLYVVDMEANSIVISSKVSHAYNSGKIYATDFSNVPGSKKSSLGAYVTGKIKYGKFGYSMIIHGLEKQNSNACSRNIIFHSSKKMNYIWSAGCFATPEKINRRIIDLIHGGCLVYVFN